MGRKKTVHCPLAVCAANRVCKREKTVITCVVFKQGKVHEYLAEYVNI